MSIAGWHAQGPLGQGDRAAGPFALNRAADAHRHAASAAVAEHRTDLLRPIRYHLASTLFRQLRFRAALQELIPLLDSLDPRSPLQAAIETAAIQMAASALTFVDLEGPPEQAPYIARADVLDIERDPSVAEAEMAIALQRVANNTIIPQDRRWTAAVYEWLAWEYRALGQGKNAAQAIGLFLVRWPLHRDASVAQARQAEIYERLAREARTASADQARWEQLGAEARHKVAAYPASGAWSNANRGDEEAIRRAGELLSGRPVAETWLP